jgi:hypothetical protein
MQGGDARTINKPLLYSLRLKRKLASRVQKDDIINKRLFLKLRIANIGLDIDSEKHSEDLLEYGICIQDHSRHAIVLQHVTSLPSTQLFALKSKRQNNNISPENFEDTKGAIIIRISKKNRKHNCQTDERTNNDLQNMHIKLKIE